MAFYSKFCDKFTDIEAEYEIPIETLNTPVLNWIEEDTLITEQRMLPINLALANDEMNKIIDPTLLVGMKFSIEDREKLCKKRHCQPPESVLSERKKEIG